jgi:hypothetical protein
MVKQVDPDCPSFTNFKLYDLSGALQPAGLYEILVVSGIEYLNLKPDVQGSYDHVLGFEASGGTPVSLTSVPFKQINCGFETITNPILLY